MNKMWIDPPIEPRRSGPPRRIERLRVLSLCAGFVLAFVVLGLLLSDDLRAPRPLFPNADKLFHALAFMALGFLFCWRASLAEAMVFAIALGLYAAAIEQLQAMLTVTRTASLFDAVASLGGLAFGVAAGQVSSRRPPR